MGRATSYAELTALAEGAGLGSDLVVQTPYGDSGRTTFFVQVRGGLGPLRAQDERTSRSR